MISFMMLGWKRHPLSRDESNISFAGAHPGRQPATPLTGEGCFLARG
jgi:hypothetical protein